MVRYFIHHPVLSIVISLVILIAGAVCIPNLPVAQLPDICPPVIEVSTVYTGANAQVVEETVASPIEQQVNGCEKMLYMRSLCTNQGYYTLQVTFDISRDQDMAMVDVKNRLALADPLLPQEVKSYGVNCDKKMTQALMYISFYSPDKSRDTLFVSNYVTINIKDRLARVSGVGKCDIIAGGRDFAMRLWAKPDKMAKLHVTCDDIVSTIASQNVQAAAGSIGDPPQAQPVQIQYPVNVRGRLLQPEEFENCIITTKGSSVLRVRDVAHAELGAKTYNSEGRRDDSPAVLLAIYQQPGANALTLANQIRDQLKEIAEVFPPGMAYEITYDTTVFVTKSIEEVVHTLRDAIILVLIVVLAFLGNIRASIVPILALPVSLVGTFAGFAALGFSINLLTLFGLVLAVGIVVDDAIVVVEAVELGIEHGLSPMAATEKAMDEVSGAVIAIALVLCAVFVPVAFMGGMTGIMYKQFAITLAVSVMLSAVVALTMTPALCAMILRPRKEGNTPLDWFNKIFNGVFGYVTKIYVHLVRWSIKLVIPSLALLALVYGGAYWIYTTMPTGFIPNEDMGAVVISITLPDGASLSRVTKVADQVNELALKQPETNHTIVLTGYNFIQGNFASNCSGVIMVLKDWDLRLGKEHESFALVTRMNQLCSSIHEGNIMAFIQPTVQGLSQTGGVTLELQDRAGSTVQALADTTNAFCKDALQTGVSGTAYHFFRTTIPMLNVEIDRDKLMELGIPVNSAFTAMQVNLGGYFINQFNQFGRTWDVYLQAESQYRRVPSDVGQIYLRTNQGTMMPLSNVSTVSQTSGPDVLIRYNLFRATEVNADPLPGQSSGQTIAGMEALAKKLPTGFGSEWTSTAYQEKLSSGQTGQILIFGLVFVFLFLAAQYESWGVPFSIMLSMPTVVFGALLGCKIAGMDMNIYVQIGMLTLIGLSAKNAILIVEYAKNYYEQGMELLDATVEACRVRFRPILMTSFAFIMGVVPLARAVGASAICRRALGISVMSGMLAATLLGVFIIPAMYVFVQRCINFFTGDSRKNKQCKPENDVVPNQENKAEETSAKDEQSAAKDEQSAAKDEQSADKDKQSK